MNKKKEKTESLEAVHTHTHTHTDNFKEKGITLVALVVTIVVLLILAGVSINLVLGDNGIINKARDARDKSAQASQNDLTGMDSLEGEMKEALGELVTTKETAPYLPDATFKKVDGTINTGLVIEDGEGNQYVWVVVPRTKDVYGTTELGKTTFTAEDYASIETDLKNYTNTYRDGTDFSDTWDADTYNEGWLTNDEYTELKNKMLKSVYENGGFYVGRYEAGIGANRTSASSTNSDGKYDITGLPTPLSQADAYPYTYVTRTQAQKLAESLSNGKSYTSSLMFGVQWDLVLAFMAKDTTKITSTTVLTSNSTSIGNYYNSVFDLNRGKYAQYGQLGNEWKKSNEELSPIVVNNTETGKMKKTEQSSYKNGILLTTGATEQSKVMNIYDIAGNVYEWTLENVPDMMSIICAHRGGSCYVPGSNGPASYHGGNGTTGSYDLIGFRVSLF